MKTPELKSGYWSVDYLKLLANGETPLSETSLRQCAEYIEAAYKAIDFLESRLAQAERERDAAVSDINFYQLAVCFTCSNHIPPEEREDWRIYCKKYGRLPEVISDKRPTFCSGYNWRGVCEENTKEETKGGSGGEEASVRL